MTGSKLHQLALTQTSGVGNSLIKTLISYCGSPEDVFTTPRGKLEKIPGVGKMVSTNIINHKEAFEKAEIILKATDAQNAHLLFYTENNYPTYLKQLIDSPALIYLKGNLLPENRRYISIVGTRQATKEGKQIVDKIIRELAPYNPVIISGLAYGIDIEAHKAALENNLETFGVMATGLEKIYPSIHTKIANKMLEKGGVLTEYPPGIKMDPAYFPARNRIIAGLSEATLIIEAGIKGGALITAYLARDYDREVFAIPGSLTSKLSEGCNHIIKNNLAQLVTSADDIAFFLGWERGIQEPIPKQALIRQEDVSNEEWKVIQLLSSNELHIDEISWKSQIQLGKLASILLNLEFRNIVISMPGKKYRLK